MSPTPGPCGDPECHVLHADAANPVHPPFYVDSRISTGNQPDPRQLERIKTHIIKRWQDDEVFAGRFTMPSPRFINKLAQLAAAEAIAWLTPIPGTPTSYDRSDIDPSPNDTSHDTHDVEADDAAARRAIVQQADDADDAMTMYSEHDARTGLDGWASAATDRTVSDEPWPEPPEPPASSVSDETPAEHKPEPEPNPDPDPLPPQWRPIGERRWRQGKPPTKGEMYETRPNPDEGRDLYKESFST